MTSSVSLGQRVSADLTTAMKAHEAATVATLRLVVSALKNEKIVKQHELTDDEVLTVLAREAKKRKESITSYTAGGRAELAAQEQAELEIIQRYLPQAASPEEVKRVVQEVAAAHVGRPFGVVMGKVMAQLKGRADGALVQQLVKEQLAQTS